MSLTVIEHPSPSYAPRTLVNAAAAELTAAFAFDYTTGGERLTRRAADDRYIALPLTESVESNARSLYRAMKRRNASDLNIAGNGAYTLIKYKWSQTRTNLYVYRVLSSVFDRTPITRIYSGGQTGIDLAGMVAGVQLGIEVIATMPFGCLMRNVDGVDTNQTKQEIRNLVEKYASRLDRSLCAALRS